MKVKLAYGSDGLVVDLPDYCTIMVEPAYHPEVEEPPRLLRQVLRNPVAGPPLRDCVNRGQTVAISMCDGTRPQPRHLVILSKPRIDVRFKGMTKELVTNELWTTIEPLLPSEPPKPKGGRPRVDNRAALTGIWPRYRISAAFGAVDRSMIYKAGHETNIEAANDPATQIARSSA